MIFLLQDERVKEYDILVIQESWHNAYMLITYNAHLNGFHLVHSGMKKSRVCFYINARIKISTWKVTFSTKDTDTLIIEQEDQMNRSIIHIHNIYNSLSSSYNSSELNSLKNIPQMLTVPELHILLRDFNLHHSYWSGLTRHTQHVLADNLIEMIQEKEMKLALSVEAVTWEARHTWSMIDLVFISEMLSNIILHCKSVSALEQSSDHISISTEVLWKAAITQSIKWHNWKKVNVNMLNARMHELLSEIQLNDIYTEIKRYAEDIERILHTVMNELISVIWISTHFKAWWNEKCARAIKHARKLWCKGYHNCQDSRYREYLKAVKIKGKLIQKVKRDEFRENVQRLTESSMTIWKLTKWVQLESMKLREALQISDLTDVISTVITQQEKVETLKRKFFFLSSQTDMWDIIEFAYSDQLSSSSEIQKEEVNTVIHRLKVKKASGSDKISNELLKMLTNMILAHLVTLFNACMKHEIHSIRYKETKTIALRKSEKDDYTKSGAYRSIALLNMTGKVLKAIMVSRLSDSAERHTLLSDAQMRVRKGWSTETALQLITEQVHTIWKQRTHKVITILCLNQEEAFDNVRIERLIHNLKVRAIPKYLIDWVQSFMTDRKMTIQLPGYESSLFSINTEIPQGSSISSILFLFFNSELISACTQLRKGISSVEFMNDVNILIYEDSTANNCKKLKVMHKECEQWAQTHVTRFTPVKYELMHLTKTSKQFDMNVSLSLEDLNIHSSTSVHILGIQVNSKLWWGAHIKKIEAKMMTQMLMLSKLSMSMWGASFQNVRQIYSAVIQPAWTYESAVWYHSKRTCEMKNHIIKRMTVI